MAKIVAGAKDFGGSNAIVSTLEKASEEHEVYVLSQGNLPNVINEKGLELEIINLSDSSYNSVRGVVLEIDPDIVLTGTSVQTDKMREVIDQNLVRAARDCCPSLSILDLWKSWLDRFSDKYSPDGKFHSELDESGKLCFLPTRIGVMDQFSVDKMVRLGFPEEKLVVTGNPAFDHYVKSKDCVGGYKIRDNLGLRDKELFVWISQPMKAVQGALYGEVNEQTGLSTFLGGLDSTNRVVVVSANPKRENIADLEDIAKRFSHVDLRIDGTTPVKDLIYSADFVATVDSTDFYRALCNNVPVISVQYNGEERVSEMMAVDVFKEIIPIVRSSNQVEEAIMTARRNLNTKNLDFLPDGKATERVYNLVKSMIYS